MAAKNATAVAVAVVAAAVGVAMSAMPMARASNRRSLQKWVMRRHQHLHHQNKH